MNQKLYFNVGTIEQPVWEEITWAPGMVLAFGPEWGIAPAPDNWRTGLPPEALKYYDESVERIRRTDP